MLHIKRVLPILVVLALLAGLGAMAVQVSADHHQAQIQAATSTKTAIQPLTSSTDIVYTTRTGECYHKSTCSCLKKSKIKTTRGEAIKAGYRACSKCNP